MKWYVFNSRSYMYAVEARTRYEALEYAKTVDGFGHGCMGAFTEDECVDMGVEDFYDNQQFADIM